jgi:hypothetical protein
MNTYTQSGPFLSVHGALCKRIVFPKDTLQVEMAVRTFRLCELVHIKQTQT